MTLNGNVDPHKRMKSTRNSNYIGKYKILILLFKYILK